MRSRRQHSGYAKNYCGRKMEVLAAMKWDATWEGEFVMWKLFVAFCCGMRLAAHVATIRRTSATGEEDSQKVL